MRAGIVAGRDGFAVLRFSKCVRGAAVIGLAFVGLVAIGGPALAAPGDVTTLAGSGVPGNADGIGVAASFWNPTDVVTDAAGNIYVADASNDAIRKVTPAGVVTTFAAGGLLNVPSAIAIDSLGTLYVANYQSSRILKISPVGVVTLFAGSVSGVPGKADGLGAAASFKGPYGLAVDSAGNVYVGDTGNHLIRKITPGGLVSTFAGSGAAGYVNATGTTAQFNVPHGLAVDAANNVFVADSSNQVVRKISPAGVVTTFAGSGPGNGTQSVDGLGTAATFGSVWGLAFDLSGNLLVTDRGNGKIRSITPAGMVSTLAGGLGGIVKDGNGLLATFATPDGLAVDSAGTIYVADDGSETIRKIEPLVDGSGSSSTTTTTSTSTTSTTAAIASSTSTTVNPASTTATSAVPIPTSTAVVLSSTSTTSTPVPLVFATIPVLLASSVGPVSVVSTTTVATSLAPPTTVPVPSPTLTVAALVQQSSIPQAVVAGPSVEGVSATATPAYTGSSSTSTLVVAVLLLSLGIVLLAGRSILGDRTSK